ncbi:hypothetical protein G6F57_021378 [Rhizopus arrhizus]|nr:hypothetical protein G6F57_021378 [Rhizopus arrhizus]
MRPTFDDVYLITPKQVRARSDEVDALEAWLGAELPSGYRQFVSTLGQGTYCGRLMVLMPSQIQAECESERAFVREYFDDFWGEDSSLSMQDAAQGHRSPPTLRVASARPPRPLDATRPGRPAGLGPASA